MGVLLNVCIIGTPKEVANISLSYHNTKENTIHLSLGFGCGRRKKVYNKINLKRKRGLSLIHI